MTAARFWREIPARYNLIGTRCTVCGRIYFPPREVCPHCHRKSIGKMERHKMKGKGHVLSYTVVKEGSANLAAQTPYIMAIIQLEEGENAKLTAQLVECEEGDLKIGLEVEAVFRKIQEDGKSGVIHYGYKFKPV